MFLNNPKDLDPSYKMDLDIGIVLEWKKKNSSYNGRNRVAMIILLTEKHSELRPIYLFLLEIR